jgi:alanyl-tRNA synthetase
MFSIVGSEQDRGSLRLRFLAGDRLLTALQQGLCREQQLSSLLSVPPSELVRVTDSLLQDKKNAAKAMKASDEELSLLFATLIVEKYIDATAATATADPDTTPAPVVVLHRPGASLSFLQVTAECMLQLSAARGLGIQVSVVSVTQV